MVQMKKRSMLKALKTSELAEFPEFKGWLYLDSSSGGGCG